MSTINPFNDPGFKKQVLEDNGFGSIIQASPVMPKNASSIILDAALIEKSQKEQKAAEINIALNDIFTRYNQEYGTDLSVDFSNLSRTLINVSDPDTRRTLELYVSEVFKSVRPVLLLHLISKLSLAIDYVLQPERMFDSNSFSPADLFLVIEKLMSYIEQLNEIMKTTTIENSDQILKKLSEEKQDKYLESKESKEAISEFMSLLKKESGINN